MEVITQKADHQSFKFPCPYSFPLLVLLCVPVPMCPLALQAPQDGFEVVEAKEDSVEPHLEGE